MQTIFILVVIVALIFVFKSIKVVPQQHAYVIERLGRFHATLGPGLNIIIPFLDRLAYKHDLREIPLDVPSQICITKDNTQLQVDGILYFQVTDPQQASYGSSNFVLAITQLAQTTLRSIIGRMELDKTFEERDDINRHVVSALDEAAANWGVKVLRYEIKDLTPPKEILHAMQAQITAEREKRALIAASEGRKQEQINIATGQREAAIQQSEGEKQSFINRSEGEKQAAINRAEGESESIRLVARATAEAIHMIAQTIRQPGGTEAVNLKIAEQYIDAFGKIAKSSTTMLLPANASDVAGIVATAMNVVKTTQAPGSGSNTHR
ncbi:SPFH domain-containing protein [Parachitinimonas caeni]|uniref:SPFH/Band 7/PHB domain protein n=1 Tax=Parachitinimonas caeni TaxID=3031301 RepID=A0ABT7E079_9NEIS|nr:SPFH domain-containing protein [Parachitinimonas caeni]MDK2125713.1 SPFH/Band 7/PHB domain protein [Parachitinimonas caeni]